MQQINLYLPEFRPNRAPLRAQHMALAIMGFIVLLGLFSMYSLYRQGQLEDQLAQEKLALESTQLQLQKLALQAPLQSKQLDDELLRLQKERDRRQQILAVISNQDLGNAKGFSGQLTAMAKQSLDSLALETFALQKGGRYVEFSGKTRQPDQVPLYIQHLRTEADFAAVRFGVLTVERDEKNNQALSFRVAKSAANEEKN